MAPNDASILERYRLIGHDASKSSRYEAFVVRLTDASLKSLNESVSAFKSDKSKGGIGRIEIKSNGPPEGIICFGGVSDREYQFSLADAQRDLGSNGQLEAVRISRNRKGAGIMKSLGLVGKRLQIAATTEDTFELTKEKTKQANEEMKKNTAKVLKGPAGRGSKRVQGILVNKAKNSVRNGKLARLGGATIPPRPPPSRGSQQNNSTSLVPAARKNSPPDPPTIRVIFPPIKTLADRQRYKQRFDKDYQTYVAAYKKLNHFAVGLRSLQDKLNDEASSHAGNTHQEEVMNKHSEFKSTEIQRLLDVHQKLKRKLEMIKMRVKEFDRLQKKE